MSLARRLGVLACVLASIAGCSAERPDVDDARGVSVENCGVRVRVSQPPQRAVALDQQTTETLLALGLGDRIAGTALRQGPVPAEYRVAYDKIPLLNPKELTGEQLRAANPDFAASAVTTDFTRERVGTRDELAGLGVPTYVSSVDCPKDEPGRSPFERLFTDYEDFGRIFSVTQRAADLMAEQRAKIASVGTAAAARTSKPTVVYLYSVFNGTPYVAGGTGIPAEISRITNSVNVFDDVDQDFPEVSWEQIAARNPSIFVLGDLPERGEEGDTAADKIQLMRSDPALSHLDAVRMARYIVVPGTELDPSVRSVDALDVIDAGLAKLG